jgi:chromosome segregation protein
MHLKSLRVQGFKTFARKTDLSFGRGITSIVGPNGSGKSNLVDAIRWALGEKSARGLRGQRMEDVIFAGGPGRAPMGMAEVSLLIDNADQRVPLDFAEIEITRRMFRSGESDYFINGSRARLRDIEALLAHTGLTQDGYAIVAQNDIDFVIQAAPTVRRSILEEAAGVRVVRTQHTEARQRLADARANLQRAYDVLQEITPRVEELRGQAERAEEAERLQGELTTLQGSLQLDRWRKAKQQLRKAELRLRGLEEKLADATARASEVAQRYEGHKSEMQAAQQARLSHQETLGALRVELAALEGRRALAVERAAATRAGQADALATLAEIAQRRQAAAALHAQVEGERRLTGTHAQTLEQDLAALAQQAEVEVARLRASAEQELERARQAAGQSAATAQRLAAERGTLEVALAAAEEAAAAARSALDNARAEMVALKTLRDRARPSGPSPLAASGARRLREVLDVEPRYLPAIEAALEGTLDAWLASSVPDLEAAVEKIAERVDAREMLLFSAPALPAETQEWSAVAGVIGAAHHVVRAPAALQPLLDRLLSGVWLVEDRRQALALRRSHQSATWVTVAGEIITSDRYIGGKAANPVLTLEQDLRAAARAEEAADVRFCEATAARDRCRLQRQAVQEPLQAALRAQELSAAEVERAGQHLAALQGRSSPHLLDPLSTRRLHLEAELGRYQQHLAHLDEQLARIASEQQQLQADAARFEERAAGLASAAAATDLEAQSLGEMLLTQGQLLTAAEGREWNEVPAADLRERLRREESEHVDAQVGVAHAQDAVAVAQSERQVAMESVVVAEAELPEASRGEEGEGSEIEVDWQRTEREVGRLLRRIEALGPVNPLAPAEYRQASDRAGTIQQHVGDLEAAITDLQGLMTRLQREITERFDAVFQAVAYNFQEYFGELFDGGRATLRLEAPLEGAEGEESEDPGVEILAQTPGKRLQALTLLSGGERALTALAFIFAVQQINPSPFYVLDEVDAALDDANVGRFNKVLIRLARGQQFLIVTHNHSTMAQADVLYGVTLGDHGVSKMVSVRLNEIPAVAKLQEQTA